MADKTDIFLSVIETHKGIIYKIANSYCTCYDNRNDLIQEIILKLWQAFDGYNSQYKHSTWLYRIALNTAISYYRKEKVRKKNTGLFTETVFDMAGFEKHLPAEHNSLLLNQFIAELKQLDKALLLLYLEEKSHKEIAAILGISETNVATKIGRIKAALKQRFLKTKN